MISLALVEPLVLGLILEDLLAGHLKSGLEQVVPPGLEQVVPPGLELVSPPGLERVMPPGLEQVVPPGLLPFGLLLDTVLGLSAGELVLDVEHLDQVPGHTMILGYCFSCFTSATTSAASPRKRISLWPCL